jgi:hypothetical protein
MHSMAAKQQLQQWSFGVNNAPYSALTSCKVLR